MSTLLGRRVLLRPLSVTDFPAWTEVRTRNADWLLRWEPRRLPGQPDVTTDRDAFSVRCSARERERQLGTGYGFGIFVEGRFAGEINLSAIQRGPFQSAYVGYWIDEAEAGRGYTPEALVVLIRFAFDDLRLRVVEKVKIREEGVAERYLEINGVWEDHVRYAITAEEWQQRRDDLLTEWID